MCYFLEYFLFSLVIGLRATDDLGTQPLDGKQEKKCDCTANVVRYACQLCKSLLFPKNIPFQLFSSFSFGFN